MEGVMTLKDGATSALKGKGCQIVMKTRAIYQDAWRSATRIVAASDRYLVKTRLYLAVEQDVLMASMETNVKHLVVPVSMATSAHKDAAEPARTDTAIT
ncbi:hypothetical protein ElyMa_002254600 [Elysia marginata]|uniref:Uncharacterized protein n=1 Tax=Elysia marginata TaxID=1093978 RepID=A0AAV4FXY4_9GAST|nr:hypothetical protein ElyMa_002254600 [Elysia marginata]